MLLPIDVFKAISSGYTVYHLFRTFYTKLELPVILRTK